jgi:MYXO-CTERM domain-containing protein
MMSRYWIGIVAGALGVALVTPAAADPQTGAAATPISMSPAVVSVSGPNGGNMGRLDGDMRLRGPGFEQTAVIPMSKNGNEYIVLITMQSILSNQQTGDIGPWQCACSSYQLNASAPPTQIANLVRLTNLDNGERLCNHPAGASDGTNILWMYGSDTNSNRPNTYAAVTNEKCQTVAAAQMVNLPMNSNDGAPAITFNGIVNGVSKFTGGYLETGGTLDQVYAMGLSLSANADGITMTLNRDWIQSIISPSNIGRPTIVADNANRTVFCASEGNNRPPEGGVQCAYLDSMTGNILYKNTMAASDPNKMIYMSQPNVAKLADGQFVLQTIASNAMGRNTNLKGTNLTYMYSLTAAGDALQAQQVGTGMAAYQTHASLCTGAYGVSGNKAVSVISASATGIGRPMMMMLGIDPTTKAVTYDENNDKWPIAWYGDSGHLANWYGRNPMRQGRDFMRCAGDIKNPGHGVQNGFMSNVSTFFAAAVSGRVPGDAKNSLTLSLVPGQVDTAVTPQNPSLATDVGASNAPVGPPPAAPSSSSGCACSTVGGGNGTSDFAGLALLGLGLAVIASRRRS